MTERLLRCTRVEPRTVGGQHVVANSSHKRTANRSGRHSHSQQAQSEPNRARDIGPRMLTSQPSAYLMTMELHRRRRASRGQSKPFDEMRLSTCRGARSTAAAQRQSAEGSRSTAGSSHRSARSYRRAESRHAKDQQIDQHSQLFRKAWQGKPHAGTSSEVANLASPRTAPMR